MAQRLTYTSNNSFPQAALNALVRANPREMSARVETMPAGELREHVAQAVAMSFVREDPDADVAWVGGLDPPSQNARMVLIQTLAAVDLDRGSLSWPRSIRAARSRSCRTSHFQLRSRMHPAARA
jgi:hypothetical protein